MLSFHKVGILNEVLDNEIPMEYACDSLKYFYY